MKTLLNRKLTIVFAALQCISSVKAQVSNPQSKIKDYKFKNNLLLRMKQNQSLKKPTGSCQLAVITSEYNLVIK